MQRAGELRRACRSALPVGAGGRAGLLDRARSSCRRRRRSAPPATGGFQLAISEEGKTLRKRGSRGFGSASAFSLIIESYWSIESSSVFELRITSRPKNSAVLRTPGIFERCGCQESAATPFSERDPDAVVGVDAERVVAVRVARGPDQRHALAQLDVPVDQHDVVRDQVLDPVLDVPGPLHRVQRGERVPLLALGDQLRVREQRRRAAPPRPGSARWCRARSAGPGRAGGRS